MNFLNWGEILAKKKVEGVLTTQSSNHQKQKKVCDIFHLISVILRVLEAQIY